MKALLNVLTIATICTAAYYSQILAIAMASCYALSLAISAEQANKEERETL
jgi:hypothetical protein